MKRRDLLFNLSGGEGKIANTLDQLATPLTKAQALHLLRRLSFHPTPDQVNQITGKTASEAFELIVGDGSATVPDATSSMKSWLDTLEEDPLDNLPQDIRSEIEGKHKARFSEFANWWLNTMQQESFPAMEKLTLFLHTIWCTEFTYDTLAYLPPPLLYRNNLKLRQNRLGNYKDIAKQISLDGAMIMYQSLFYSGKAAPNENYMRELMELFTMGIADLSTGNQNYTEGDIKEGAKALTGWRTVAYLGQNGAPANKPFETFFVKNEHDTGAKTIFQTGQIQPISDVDNTEDLVKEKEVYGLIDILFAERGISIARFVCDKMMKYFIYSDPNFTNMSIMNELADYMMNNSFNLKLTMKKLMTSQFFYSDSFIGCQIKTPTEFIIGLERMLGIDYDSVKAGNTRTSVFSLEQILYDPPNVGSWKAYRTWISTTTYPLRAKYSRDMITNLNNSILKNLVSKFPASANNVTQLVADICEYFLPKAVSSARLDKFKVILLNGMSESEWLSGFAASSANAMQGIKLLLNNIVLSPDFQLC